MQNVSLPEKLRKYETGNHILIEGTLQEIAPIVREFLFYLQKESRKRKRIRNLYQRLPDYISGLLIGSIGIISYVTKTPFLLVSYLFFPALYFYLRKIRQVKCRYRYIFPSLHYDTLIRILSELQTENPHQKIHLKLYKSFYEKRLKYLLFLHSREKRIFFIVKYLAGASPFRYDFKVKKWKIFAKARTYTLYYKISVHYKENLKLKISKILEAGTSKEKEEREWILEEFFVEYTLF